MPEESQKFTRQRRSTVVHECPCGKKNRDGKFAPFEGYTDKGFCHSCGDTFWPDDEKEVERIKAGSNKEPEQINFISNVRLKESLKECDQSDLYQYISQFFGGDATSKAFVRYNVGSLKGKSAFFTTDRSDKLRSCKLVPYKDGRRQGTPYALDGCTIPNGYVPVLFGEHLLKGSGRTVGLVESEKTAIMCSLLFPKIIWIATGGSNGATESKVKPLKGHHVLLFVDADEGGRKSARKTAFNLKSSGVSYSVVDLFESKNDGYDLADFIEDHILNSDLVQMINQKIQGLEKELRGDDIDYEKGIYRFRDFKKSMLHSFHHGQLRGEPVEWDDIKPYMSWRKGMIYLWTGYPNHGKSEFLFHLMLLKSAKTGAKWIIYPPENFSVDDNGDLTPEEIGNTLIHTYVGKSTDKTRSNCMSALEYERAIDFIDKHFFIVYPDNYKTSPKQCLDYVQYLIDTEGSVMGVVIDPWNKLYHDYKGGLIDDYLAVQFSMMKAFAIKNNIVLNVVVHPKAPPSGEDVPPPNAFSLRGGAMWNNGADGIFSIHRPDWFIEVMPDGSSGRMSTRVTFNTLKLKNQKLMGILGSAELKFSRAENRYKGLNGKSPFGIIKPPPKQTEIVGLEGSLTPVSDVISAFEAESDVPF